MGVTAGNLVSSSSSPRRSTAASRRKRSATLRSRRRSPARRVLRRWLPAGTSNPLSVSRRCTHCRRPGGRRWPPCRRVPKRVEPTAETRWRRWRSVTVPSSRRRTVVADWPETRRSPRETRPSRHCRPGGRPPLEAVQPRRCNRDPRARVVVSGGPAPEHEDGRQKPS